MTADLVASLFFVAAGLLAVGGAAKLRNPVPTAGALEQAGLPARRSLVRTLGGLELLVGVSGLAWPNPAARIALAAMYVGFTAFLQWIRSRPNSERLSCGCLGAREAPPSMLHVCLNVLAVACGIWAALEGIPTLPEMINVEGVNAAAYVVSLVLLGWLTMAMVVYVPGLMSAYEPPPKHEQDVVPRLSAEQAFTTAGLSFDDSSLWLEAPAVPGGEGIPAPTASRRGGEA